MSLKITITNLKQEVVIENPQDRPLLDQLEVAGVTLSYGCRAGSCGSCMVEIKSGMEHFKNAGPVEEDTVSRCGDTGNMRLSCRACLKAGASGEIVLSEHYT